MLGWTSESIDIGLPDRSDVHFDMAEQPAVTLARSADPMKVRVGERVAIVVHRGRVRALAVVESGVRLLTDGRSAWDRPAGSTLVVGRVRARHARAEGLAIRVDHGGDFVLSDRTPSITLAPSSRRALLSPQHVLIFARSEEDGISDFAERIVLAEGEVRIPL